MVVVAQQGEVVAAGYLVERGGRMWFGHTGEDHGASARAFHSPADGVSLVVLSNLTEGAGSVFRRLTDSLPPAA